MNAILNPNPVVVTFREVERILTGTEAVPQITEAANCDNDVTPEEKGAILAGMGNVLNELRKAEAVATPGVLTSPHHGPASRFQSLIASGDYAKLSFAPLTAGGREAKFDTNDWFGWDRVAWEKLKHLIPHEMLRPKTAIPTSIPAQGRIALLGDWGTGLYGAPLIAQSVRNDPDPFLLLLHLGDVYYSGTKNEVQERFLDVWPYRPEAMNRALNSNHEMYSGGEFYYDNTLDKFGQDASYFALQNEHWTLVGLDVAYHDHAIDDAQVDWLDQILAQAGNRKVVLFSHHQLYSHFEIQGSKLWGHPKFGSILRSRRIFAWYWGHEHRCAIFEDVDSQFGLYGRCIGHSGMPQSRDVTLPLPKVTESAYAKADWRRSPAQMSLGNRLPSCVVLEGPNPYIVGEETKFTPHGYAVLTLDGPALVEEIRQPDGQVIYRNVLSS